MTFYQYEVAPFSGRNYHRNAAKCSDEPCAICGKPVTNVQYRAIVVAGGSAWGDESSPEDGGYMGTYPIGADCHRKYVLRIGALECSCGQLYNPLPSQRNTTNGCPKCRAKERA